MAGKLARLRLHARSLSGSRKIDCTGRWRWSSDGRTYCADRVRGRRQGGTAGSSKESLARRAAVVRIASREMVYSTDLARRSLPAASKWSLRME